LEVPLVVLLQEVAVMERHLRLVPPLVQEALPLGEEALKAKVPQWALEAQSLVPVRVRALAQQLALAQRLAQDLEEELVQGLEEGLQLPQVLVEDLVLARAEAQELASALARVAVLARVLEQE
jgi:hypothetical protein